MVTAKTQYNLKNAQEYFEVHLAVGDYYAEGQRVTGEWREWLSQEMERDALDMAQLSRRMAGLIRREAIAARDHVCGA